jgi:hypothetical protein
MNKNKRVSGRWDVGFHNIVEQARKDYSRQLGRELHITDVTRIWGEGKLAKFRYPKLRLRKIRK